jgi:hypothetical protein
MEVSRLNEFLGGIVDRHPGRMLSLANMESRWLSDRLQPIQIDRPIYISGLARAGTTILLEMLANHSSVTTHKYRDYPLVHMPVWWNQFLDRAAMGDPDPVERAHKDGIHVTPDSPEAMEEILWMAYFPDCHNPSVSNVLDGHSKHPEFEKFYRDHIKKMILIRSGDRYLAKGNYNVSRLGYLNAKHTNARFVIPVRDPVSHVASLIKQHRLFCDEERKDPRVLKYMCRSGHFEFGLDRRPINFGDDAAVRRISELWESGQEVRGWAAYWSLVYGFLAGQFQIDQDFARRAIMVHYDNFCREPQSTLTRVFGHCELEIDSSSLASMASKVAAPTYYSSDFTTVELDQIHGETAETEHRILNLSNPGREATSAVNE